jgi:16S rRNA (cytosine967-C5)-methyltransferase
MAARGAAVVAVERDSVRLARLRQNLQHWHLPTEVVQADAASWSPGRLFDAILLDAPCSATGTIRRHPDVPHLKRPRDVRSLAEAQDRLLQAAATMLRPGGRLIYSVCSLQPEEGVPRVRSAISAGNLHHDPFTAAEIADLPEALTSDGFLQTSPNMWSDSGGMDGFFVARMVKD